MFENIGPEQTPDELLAEIKEQARQDYNFGGVGKPRTTALVPLSALLINLSRTASKNTADLLAATREASVTADKTLRVTKYLFWATIVLLVVTVLPFGFELMKQYQATDGEAKAHQRQSDQKPESPRRNVVGHSRTPDFFVTVAAPD